MQKKNLRNRLIKKWQMIKRPNSVIFVCVCKIHNTKISNNVYLLNLLCVRCCRYKTEEELITALKGYMGSGGYRRHARVARAQTNDRGHVGKSVEFVP